MSQMTGAEAMVRMLQLHGVKHIFGLCGDTSLPFYDALARLDHGIQHILTRDERSAAYMADGYARVSGRVGVCEGPSGGGATYLLPGIVEANESSIPVLGITTDSEAGVDDINHLVDFLVEHKVPAVFVETSVNSRNIEAVIEGAARRGWKVHVGGNLFSDAMGAPGTYEGTYVGMLDHNATVIARALGGTAPERGLDGKLTADGPPSSP